MDQDQFDRFVSAMGATRPRRAILAAAGAAMLSLRAALTPAADARPKKKPKKPTKCPNPRKCGKSCCKKGQQCLAGVCGVPCTFTTNGLIMSLDRSCVLTEDSTVPLGMILDGGNKTITLGGNRSTAPSIRINEGIGAVQHLTIDARRLTGPCADERNLISFAESSGSVEDVTIHGMRCSSGIAANAGSTTQALTITGLSLTGAGRWGIHLSGPESSNDGRLLVSMQDVTLRGSGKATPATGIYARSTVDLQVRDSSIAATGVGIDGRYDSVLNVANTTVTGAQIGILISKASETGTALTAVDNKIVGPGAPATAGIYVEAPGIADLQRNRISRYLNRPGDPPACGIFIASGASGGTLSSNTFPGKGNQQDICT